MKKKRREEKRREQQAKQNATYENKKDQLESENKTESSRFLDDQKIKIREDNIAAMKDGSDKELEQMKLNHDKEMQELKREQEDYLKNKQDKARELFTSNPKNKGKTFDASKITLSKDESDSFDDRKKSLLQKQAEEYNEYYRKVLENYQTYAQARLAVTEKFEEQRKAFENAKASNEQFTQLSKDEKDALEAVDQQFAKKQDSYKVMLATISDMSITQLKAALELASKTLDDYTRSHSHVDLSENEYNFGTGGTITTNFDSKSKIIPNDDNNIATLRAEIETLQQKLNEKQAKNVINKTKSNSSKDVVKEWKSLSTVLDSVDRKMSDLGNTIGGTTGEALKAASTISTSVVGIVSDILSFSKISSESIVGVSVSAANAIKTVEKASVILAIISTALELLEKIKSIFSNDASNEYELKFEQERLQLAQDYNKALIEQIALQDKVFDTDKIKNALKYVNAYNKAVTSYIDLYNANTISDAKLKEINEGSNKYKRVYTTKLRNEMQIKTSQGNFWHHSKYENLEQWLKENGYGNLFNDDGSLNLDLAKSVSSMSSLTDQTKTFLNQLISAQEEVDKMDDELDDYISNEFGSLSDDIMNSLVDSIKNGTDAWTEFEKAGDDVIGNLGKELAYTLFYADKYNAFKDKIKTILKSSVDGESDKDREKRIAEEEEKATEDFFDSLKSTTNDANNFLKQWQKDAEANRYDAYTSDDTKSGSTGKLEAALTEGTASEVLGVMNMSALDIRALKDLQTSHFKDYGTEMNYIASMLDQTVQINANTYRTANNTDGLIKKLDDGFSDMGNKLDNVVKNTKGYTGRGQ